ncbi:hypothetical protein HMPREF1128_0648 [Haemophilus sputorum HK 2154]|nr:hypothetical protein HMPREF1128_0648 [Haemophilus sputorum HK 2154]
MAHNQDCFNAKNQKPWGNPRLCFFMWLYKLYALEKKIFPT